MHCDSANELMMKFMDKMLTKEDSNLLGKHLEECAKCKEDFIMYDQIMSEFAAIEMINAPDGFEQAVMAKVFELPPICIKASNSIDNMICWILGSFSVLFGIGFLLTLYRSVIMDYFYKNPELSGYADIMVSVSGYVTRFSDNIINISSSFITSSLTFVSSSRFIVLGILVVLALVQYILHQRGKIGNV